jgi:hypothetical protein
MRRFFVAGAIVVSTVSMSSAQKFEFGVDFGYGLGLGDSVGHNSEDDGFGNHIKWEQVYGGRGNGFKTMADLVFYINENFGVIAMSGYSWHGGYSTASQRTTDGLYVNTDSVRSSYVPVNIGLKFRTKMGKITPYMYLAPGLYFPKEKEIYSQVTPGLVLPDETYTYSFSAGFGFTAGVGAAIAVTDNIGVKLEITPTYAFANVTQYTDQKSGQATATYVFLNNTATLPKNPPPNTYYQFDQPRHTFNSVALKLGGYIDF